MSHSWHDDPNVKWEVLSEWAAKFQEKNGESPTLWLDKACIDQSQIAKQVPLLPVCVSGCKEFLALIGPTYPLRLVSTSALWTKIRLASFKSFMIIVQSRLEKIYMKIQTCKMSMRTGAPETMPM